MRLEFKGIIQILMGAVLLGLAAACQSTTPVSAPSQSTSPAAPQISDGEYRLGPADQLRVTVFGHDDLSNEYTVASNGTISFPLIGDIAASGLTVAEFQRLTEQRLGEGFLKSPRVSADSVEKVGFWTLGYLIWNRGERPFGLIPVPGSRPVSRALRVS